VLTEVHNVVQIVQKLQIWDDVSHKNACTSPKCRAFTADSAAADSCCNSFRARILGARSPEPKASDNLRLPGSSDADRCFVDAAQPPEARDSDPDSHDDPERRQSAEHD
jgi:hypothetical protein